MVHGGSRQPNIDVPTSEIISKKTPGTIVSAYYYHSLRDTMVVGKYPGGSFYRYRIPFLEYTPKFIGSSTASAGASFARDDTVYSASASFGRRRPPAVLRPKEARSIMPYGRSYSRSRPRGRTRFKRSYRAGRSSGRKRGASTRGRKKTRSFRKASRLYPSSVTLGKVPFPDKLRCQLRVEFLLNVNTTAGLRSFTLKGNSAFDPLGSMSSKQAMYFDQLKAIYKRYTVHATRASFFIENVSTSVPLRVALRIRNSQSTTPYTTYDQLMEQPNVRTKFIQAIRGGNTGLASMHIYGQTKTVERKHDISSDLQYQGNTVGGDPPLLWHVDLQIHDGNGDGTKVPLCFIHVVCTQYVTFMSRVLIEDA